MSRIYVACGGSSSFNGIYVGDNNNTTFTKPEDIFGTVSAIYLTNSNTTWELMNNQGSGSVLYRLLTSVNPSLPVSTNSWSVINGTSPTIQTYEFITGNTALSILIANAWSPVNGTYSWSNSISLGGGVGTVSGYYKGSGVNLFAIYWSAADGGWVIANSAGTTLYSGEQLTSWNDVPPVSNYTGIEEPWVGAGSLTETPTSRVSVVCSSASSYASNFFIGRTNNNSRIVRGADNKFYIRGIP